MRSGSSVHTGFTASGAFSRGSNTPIADDRCSEARSRKYQGGIRTLSSWARPHAPYVLMFAEVYFKLWQVHCAGLDLSLFD